MTATQVNLSIMFQVSNFNLLKCLSTYLLNHHRSCLAHYSKIHSILHNYSWISIHYLPMVYKYGWFLKQNWIYQYWLQILFSIYSLNYLNVFRLLLQSLMNLLLIVLYLSNYLKPKEVLFYKWLDQLNCFYQQTVPSGLANQFSWCYILVSHRV